MKIIVPLLHIKNTESDKNMDAEQKTAVINMMERESRTALTVNKDVRKNPKASYTLEGLMSPTTALTLMNLLCGAKYVPYTQIPDEYYVTHVLKRFDFFDYDGEYLYAMTSSVLQFLTLTTQNVSDMHLGIIITTVLETLHPFYHSGPIIPHTDTVVKMACPAAVMPIKDMRYIEAIQAYLPLRILPTTMRLNMRYSQAQFDFSFGAEIHPLENKREIL